MKTALAGKTGRFELVIFCNRLNRAESGFKAPLSSQVYVFMRLCVAHPETIYLVG